MPKTSKLLILFFLVFLPLFAGAQEMQVVRTKDNPTILRSGPSEDYDRIAELPAGLKFETLGTQKNWTRVRLSNVLSGWIDSKSLQPVNGVISPSHPILQRVKIKKKKGNIRMEILESEPGAVIAEEWLHPLTLWLKFENSRSALSQIEFAPDDPIISHVSVWQEFDDVAVMKIDLKSFSGYQMIQKDPTHLVVKFKIGKKAGLRGWKICIDPGHGGKDTGAIGPAGLREKKVTLSIAKRLAALLESRGAQVILTRTADVELTDPDGPATDELEKRVEIAREHRVDLFISIHANARPTIAEARIARGSYVYYYQPGSFKLAEDVSVALEKQINEPKYGVIFRSLHVIRETDFPAILIETVFISNPITEARLANPAYRKKVARGIFKGILRFVNRDTPG